MFKLSKQICVALLLLALSRTSAEATLMKYLEIEDLTRLATEVIHGQVLSTKTYWDNSHTRILTGVRLQVSECFKGKSARGAAATLVQLGGTLDGVTMDYSGRPTFRAGEDVIVFARPNQHNELLVVGLKQGKLAVRNNEAQRELGGIVFIDADVKADLKADLNFAQHTTPRKTVQMRYPMNELRERIARIR